MDNNVLNLDLHTVILMVGPSGCGKTYFAKNHLIPSLGAKMFPLGEVGGVANIQYLGSDDIRREVIGDPTMHKHDRRMMQVSHTAFELLHKKLDLAMQWPYNAQFVVVDTTGLSTDFRSKIVQQAKAGNYNVAVVIFDYRDGEEYQRYIDDEKFSKRVMYRHIRKLREEVYPSLNKRQYGAICKIRSKDFHKIEINVKNAEHYFSCFLDPETSYDIIGDAHGCLAELKGLIKSRGYEINEDLGTNGIVVEPERKLHNRRIVLVGDYIDKGPDQKRMVDFLFDNPEMIKLVLGNHENFVYKYLNGLVKETGMDAEFRKHYFTCSEGFEDMATQLKFYQLAENAREFYSHPDFIVTHSPCMDKYLGKIDNRSVKKQVRCPFVPREADYPSKEDYVKAMEEEFSYLMTEARRNEPFHVFGHLPFKHVMRIKNKICLDTGCVHGGRLTSVSFSYGRKPDFVDVECKNAAQPEELVDIYRKREIDSFSLDSLDPWEAKRVMYTARDKVNFISGTMAPSEADHENGILESFDKACEYYLKAGVKNVVLQPKYMGSRCNVYLNEDIEKCYATSRNGYIIKRLDLKEAFKKLLENPIVERKFKMENAEWVVIDSELMPWYALGSGLVEEHYKVVEAGIRSELNLLGDNGFEEALKSLQTEMDGTDFKKDIGSLKKQEIIKKYNQNKTASYRSLIEYNHHPLHEHIKAFAVYSQQISIYGSEGEIEFQPFAYLKIINKDGTEINCVSEKHNNFEMFSQLNDNKCRVLQLDDEEDRKRAYAWFEILTTKGKMEGVVMKPLRALVPGVAPYMKVRSPTYLSIVYGYDYLFSEKYERLIKQKKTGRKLRTSIKEFDLGRKMLDVKRSELDENNVYFAKLAAHMIAEEKKEAELDPRL